MHRKVVPKGKVLKYYFPAAAFVIAVLFVSFTLFEDIQFITAQPRDTFPRESLISRYAHVEKVLPFATARGHFHESGDVSVLF